MFRALGFETVGNATIIVYDNKKPILVTDPWITGSAYFGSWGLSHEIKPAQMSAILETEYVWISHGHPDHLNPESLAQLKNRTILLPDHVGGRIAKGLSEEGFRVQVLEDQKWIPLSKNIRVFCLATEDQDAVLLIAFGDHTVVMNVNDTGIGPWASIIRREGSKFAKRLVLSASGFGDICGINYYKENGEKILSPCEIRKTGGFEVGASNSRLVRLLGGTHFVPFSSMHVYQRTDSDWANEFLTEFTDYQNGFDGKESKLMPPYINFNTLANEWTELGPLKKAKQLFSPETFGDNWSEVLEKEDVELARKYFSAIEYLPELIDFVRLKVGGKETEIELNKKAKRGITIEAPRGSLMTALKYEIYEDLVLSNFTKLTLHGEYTIRDHTLEMLTHVARFADNGQVKTKENLAEYRQAYQDRIGTFEFLRFGVEQAIIKGVNKANLGNSALYKAMKKIYLKRAD